MTLRIGLLALTATLTLMLTLPSSSRGDDDLLTIGTPAPPLDIEHWVQDGEGKYKHVTKFEEGNVYVVEFWATWCGPCIMSMPHLAETQEKYADKKVQIISISDEKLKTVESFLDRKVAGQKKQTYRDLTKVYCLTTDPDQSAYTDYMEAAKQNGIPTAFIVGKEGRIAWIGHPMSMDKPLDAVVEGTWDYDAFAAEFAESQKLEVLQQKLARLLRRDKADEALELLDKSEGDFVAQGSKDQINNYRLHIMLTTNKTEGIGEVLDAAFKSAAAPQSVNRLAWAIYESHAAGDELPKKVLKKCLDAATSAADDADGQIKGYILDTVAHLQHSLGMLDDALATQKEALKHVSDETAEEMQEFLEELEAEKNGDSEDDDDKEESDS